VTQPGINPRTIRLTKNIKKYQYINIWAYWLIMTLILGKYMETNNKREQIFPHFFKKYELKVYIKIHDS
jgi:hypothetical protein